jgi:hypothetical protein
MDLLPAYRALVESPEQQDFCAQAGTPADFLQRLRQLWDCRSVDDGALISFLNDANHQVLDLDPRRLEGRWFPHRYDAATRSVSWLLPQGHATEPFQDQYIARCRQGSLLNQLIQPRTALAPQLSRFAEEGEGEVSPAGFIFHLSRCGSTLLSGCLAELDDTSVLSESPLLTALLLDTTLTEEQTRVALRRLVRAQAAPFPGRGRVVVKWNTWDLFRRPLIDAAFPGVPWVLLFRAPEEILASHARSAGRHMAGDPSLRHLHPAFAAPVDDGLLGWRIGVLDALTKAMREANGAGAKPIDYARLDADAIAAVCRHFRLEPSAGARIRIAQRQGVHSKTLDQPFEADGAQKRQHFDDAERQHIQRALAAGHRALQAAAGA